MVDVTSTPVFTFPGSPAVDLQALVKGPDGAPFVLDGATATVYRIDLANRKATAVFRQGSKAAGATEGKPKLLGVGGRDLLMVDDKNVVWRWRPANTTGKGTITKVRVSGATEWGAGVLAIGTFVRDAEANLYNFYVVDPTQQQILRYSPAADGGGFPAQPNNWLTAARDVSGITSMYIDGDVFVADGGQLLRLVSGNSAGWTAASPGDTILRSQPGYRVIGSASDRRAGTIYGYDRENQRVIALSKANGAFIEQYRLAGSATGWSDLRAFYVEPGIDGPDTLIWLSPNGIEQAALQPVGARPPHRRRRVPRHRPAPAGDPAPRSEPDPSNPGRHLLADRPVRRRVRNRACDHRGEWRRRPGAVLHALGRRAGGHHERTRVWGLLRAGDARAGHEPVPARRLAARRSATCSSCGSSATTSRTASGGVRVPAVLPRSAAIAAASAQVAIDPHSTVPLVGASGAIAGLRSAPTS